MQRLLVLLMMTLSIISSQIFAEERILDYQTDVTIEPSGELFVTETITVRSEAHEIKRGIYRDIPTRYTADDGSRHSVDFTLVDVKRDGQAEPYHIKELNNGERIYIGSADHYLAPNRYTYQIRYQMKRMILFGDELDELYFNVIGTGFSFPIDHASATITLPDDARIPKAVAYMGAQGSRQQDANMTSINPHTFYVESSRPLAAYEGITVAVAWNKGVVAEPSFADQLRWLWKDATLLLLALAGFAGTGIYLYFAWDKVGRDPSKGSVIPLFTPPEGLSPAACQIILDRGYRPHGMAAAFTNMVAKGYLSLHQSSKRVFTLQRIAESAELSMGESILAERLFPQNNSSLTLSRSYNAALQSATTAFKAKLTSEYGRKNFATNMKFVVVGAVISFVPFVVMILLSNDIEAAGGSIFTMIAAFILVRSIQKVSVLRSKNRIKTLISNAIPIIIVVVGINGLYQTGLFNSYNTLLLMSYTFCCAALLGLFKWLLEAPTVAGQKLVEQIEGFKLYLSVAEKDRLNFQHPPEMTLGLFERYLPYAIALGVENEWGQAFESTLSHEELNQLNATHSHFGGRRNALAMSSVMASQLESSIVSASTPPSSSGNSGFSGGSSGGGGGGGGGGGW